MEEVLNQPVTKKTNWLFIFILLVVIVIVFLIVIFVLNLNRNSSKSTLITNEDTSIINKGILITNENEGIPITNDSIETLDNLYISLYKCEDKCPSALCPQPNCPIHLGSDGNLEIWKIECDSNPGFRDCMNKTCRDLCFKDYANKALDFLKNVDLRIRPSKKVIDVEHCIYNLQEGNICETVVKYPNGSYDINYYKYGCPNLCWKNLI